MSENNHQELKDKLIEKFPKLEENFGKDLVYKLIDEYKSKGFYDDVILSRSYEILQLKLKTMLPYDDELTPIPSGNADLDSILQENTQLKGENVELKIEINNYKIKENNLNQDWQKQLEQFNDLDSILKKDIARLNQELEAVTKFKETYKKLYDEQVSINNTLGKKINGLEEQIHYYESNNFVRESAGTYTFFDYKTAESVAKKILTLPDKSMPKNEVDNVIVILEQCKELNPKWDYINTADLKQDLEAKIR